MDPHYGRRKWSRRAMTGAGRLGWIALAATSAFWIGMVGVPLGTLLSRAEGIAQLLDPGVLALVRVTALQAVVSTAISAVLGVPLGIWLGARPQSAVIRVLLSVPYSVPTVVAGTTWVAWLGRSGVFSSLDLAYSWSAVVLAHVFYNVPWVALAVARSRAALSPSLLEVAQTMGAGPVLSFRRVVWPQIRWPLGSVLAQVFSLCVMSFALVIILGGGPPVDTLETGLYARIRYGTLDVAGAAACAIWELLLTLVPWVLVLTANARIPRLESTAGETSLQPRPGRLGAVLALAVCLLFVLPYGVTLGAPFWRNLFSARLWAELRWPLWISAQLAFWSALGSVLLAGAALHCAEFLRARGGTRLSALFLSFMGLPSGISVLVLGLGAWIAYASWLDPFAGSLPLIVLLQITIFFPVALRIFSPLVENAPVRLKEAAASLGATSWQVFLAVEWPRWRGPLLGTLGVVAGASLGEVAAVSLFYSEELYPLPLLLSRWMGQYRFEDAQALAGLLFILSTGAAALVAIWGYRQPVWGYSQKENK